MRGSPSGSAGPAATAAPKRPIPSQQSPTSAQSHFFNDLLEAFAQSLGVLVDYKTHQLRLASAAILTCNRCPHDGHQQEIARDAA
jgi:hypothetical protein